MEDFVIHYGADLSGIVSDLRKLERINAQVAKEFGNDFVKASQVVSSSLDKISQTTVRQKLGKGFKDVQKTVVQTGTVVKLTNGQFRNFGETLTFVGGKLKGTKTSLRDVTATMKRQEAGTKAGGKATKTFGENLAFLTKRALTVIPVWFALRRAFTAVTGALRDGFQSFIEFDRILAKSRQNLQGSSREIEANFIRLRSEVQQTARDTGESVIKITSAFQRFATVGFDFETALAGANASTKLAVTLFGDTEKTANALARSFKVLQDRTEGAAAPSEQLTQIAAQLRDLWVDNAFTIDEFSGALERFAPVANIANFSAQQTISILAALQTAGIRGTRAGRLLSTATLQLNKNFEKINGLLGTQVNPRLQTTFERFTFVLKALKELNEIDELAATKAVQQLFGGVRGAQAVQALIAIDDVLEENLKRTGDIEKFNKALEEVTNTVSRQSDRFGELKTNIFRAFVTGIVGGDDFADSLKTVNDSLEDSIDIVSLWGETLNDIVGLISDRRFAGPIRQVLDDIQKDVVNGIKNVNEAQFDLVDRAIQGIKGQLTQKEVQELLIEFKAKIDDDTLKLSNKDRIFLEGNLRKQLEKNPIKIPVAIDPTTVGTTLDPTTQQKVAELVLKNELERQKALGATNAQLLKAELNLSKQLGLQRTEIQLLEKELDLQQAISAERESQVKLESDTLKLFRIAQTEGVDVARQIGRFLQGDILFRDFARQSKDAFAVFQREFANVFETQQALQFFTGAQVTGLKGLKGGTQIPISEELIRRLSTPQFDPRVSIQQARAEAKVQRLQQPVQPTVQVTTPIDVTVDVSNLNELAANVEDKLAQNIIQVGTKVHNAVKNVVLTT